MGSTAVIEGTYDHRLVAVSLAIAVLTSYAALDLAGRVSANKGIARVMWLLGGAFAMGSGIWAMHFTGMLAFRLPMPVSYHVPTVVVSLLAAIVASYVALYVVSRERLTRWDLVVGSLLMGTGIAAMHYTGMAAMRLRAMHHYNHGLWVLSVVIAVVVSFAGLLIISYSGSENRSWKLKLGAAIVLGLAIPLMHYTGMAAVHFMPMDVAPDLTHSLDINSIAVISILEVTLLILGFALVTSLVDRRLLEQQGILESERKMLRALIDNIPDMMFVKDKQSRFVVANRQVAMTVGALNSEAIIGRSVLELLPSAYASSSYENEQQVILSGEPIFNHEEMIPDLAGNETPVLTTLVALRDGRGNITGVAGVARNISERKKSERALEDAERKYRGMFDQALVGIFQLDADGRLLDLNPAMASFLMYPNREEMLDTLAEPLWSTAVSSKRAEDFFREMTTFGHVKAFELEVYRRDRSKIWISSTVRSILKDGVLQGFEGMFEDITERRLLRDQLLQAQKLESVGQLAAGVAHEINTPTQYIGDNVRFLKKTFGQVTTLLGLYDRLWQQVSSGAVLPTVKNELSAALQKIKIGFLLTEIPRAIDDSLEGIERVTTLVGAMKEFSHPGTKEKVPLDLNHAIQSTITVAQNEWKYVANVEVDLDPLLPQVPCLPGEFNQVILNLIVNAAHAIADVQKPESDGKGKIMIRTLRRLTGVEIRIRDTGAGIPEDVRPKIFDPFFTTKSIGKGTGQGLAIARSVIVDKHEGTIDCESVVGEGTTFTILLPCV